MNKDLKIEIRPIPGRDGIREFSQNLEYFSSSNVILPFVSGATRKYTTGLSEKDLEYLESKNCPYNLDDNYIPGVAHEFWESSIVKLELKSTPIFLFPGRSIIDFIKWRYALVSNYLYSSEKEMLEGSKPQATHYIYNESEEIELKATELEKENELVRAIAELSLQRKRDLVLIIEDEITENKKENYLTVKLNEIIKDEDKSRILRDLLKENPESVSLTVIIKSAIKKNVLRRTKQGIFFFESNLGYSEDDVKEFLSDLDNQEILLTIKSKI